MFNLADIFAKSLDGNAVNAFASQFGLKPDAAKAAIDAMLPAFSMGLNNASKSAAKMGDLFGMFTANTPFFKVADSPKEAFSYESLYAGTEAMKKIFGSEDVAKTIAQQAAQVAGVQAEAMQKMMPALSAMLMGGMLKDGMAGNNPLVAMAAQLSEAGLMPQTWYQANPFADTFSKLSDMFTRANKASASNPFAAVPGMEHLAAIARQAQAMNPMLNANPFLKANPLAGVFNPASLFGGGEEEKQPDKPTVGQQAADAWTRTFGELFSAGLKASDDYLGQLQQAMGKKPS